MNTQATLQQLRELKLDGMARSYEAVLDLPTSSQPQAHQLLAQLVQQEVDNKRFKRNSDVPAAQQTQVCSPVGGSQMLTEYSSL